MRRYHQEIILLLWIREEVFIEAYSMKQEIQDIKQMRKWKFSWRIFGENFVFRDGDHFYKMPTFLARNTMYKNIDSYEKVVDSLRIINKYFWPLTKIPKTEVFKDQDWHYIMKQQSITGDKLTAQIMKDNPKLISKFQRLIVANELMWKREGVFLDLLWSDIVTQPQTIHNLLTDGTDIYVFDFGLLEQHSKNIIFRYISRISQKFQLFFIKRFF